MADYAAPNNAIETRDDLGKDPGGVVAFWLQQLKLAEREDRKFVERGRAIVKRYRNEQPRAATTRRPARFNVFWSNVETLKPILYGRTPKPDVERRHKNNDAVARLGAMILERALAWEDDLDEFDDVMQSVVEDRLIPGRGVARVYYEPKWGDPEEDPDEESEKPDDESEPGRTKPGERPTFRPVESERAPVRYIFWEDYRESPARSEHEVWWKAYRTYLTRDELRERFGKKIGDAITLDYTPRGLGDDGETGPQADAFKKAQVWEIWDKKKKQVVWIAPSYKDKPCDTKDDPLELPGFFPSPRTLTATTTNETRSAVADYTEYQDQALELDVLTSRIDRLQRALKVAGVYAGPHKATIEQLVDETSENRLIPVEDWAAFMDKGGVQNMILWLPIEQVAKVLVSLYQARDKVLQTLYQTTGMADILRGETNPTETLGAQQLKSQFATRRISRAQKQVARFARDLMRLRGFVIARHFAPEMLMKMTGLPEPLPELPPTPPMMVPAPPQQPQAPPQPGPQPGGNVVPHPAMTGAA
jgi:hypothetical protein